MAEILNVIENQEPFNFNLSAPKLKILTTVMTMATTPTEKLESSMKVISTGLNMK